MQIEFSSAIFRLLKNIRVQLILVLVLMLASSAPILGFGLLETYRWRSVSTETAKERVLSQSEALQNEIQRIFDFRILAFETLAEQVRLQSRSGKHQKPKLYSLMKFYTENFGLVSVGMSDLQGRLLEFYHPNPELRSRILKRNILQNGFIDLLLRYRAPVVTPLKAGISSRVVTFIAVPVWDYEKKEIVATLGGSVSPLELKKTADKVITLSPLLRYRIVDQAGVVVAGSETVNEWGPVTPTPVKLFSPSEGAGPQIRQGPDEKGEEMFAAVQTLNLGTAKWTVIVSESQNDLLRNERTAWQRMAFIIACALILSFGLASLISYLISRPIVRLIEGMEMIKQGHYDQWSEMSERENFVFKEIRAAWQALSAMARRLHEYTNNLESLVAQRNQELDIQRARAVESARLASLGEMAGGIAHEINNPLSIIHLVSEQQQTLIHQGKSDIDRIREAFQNIGNTAERIVKIVHGLRSFSRDGDRDPFEIVEVKSLLENTLTLCHQKFIYNRIELSVSYDSPQLTIQCRSVQLSQVILNLLNNAFDAVESALEKWIKVEVKEVNHGVEIRVTDSGTGVPEQYREKIFQPFFTLKDVGKGTGLGLSISRRIMESQGGSLELDLNSPHTSFVVRIPQSRS